MTSLQEKRKTRLDYMNPVANAVKWLHFLLSDPSILRQYFFQHIFPWNQCNKEVKWNHSYHIKATDPEIFTWIHIQKWPSMNKSPSLVCGDWETIIWSSVPLTFKLSVDTLQGQEPVAQHGKSQLPLNTINKSTNLFAFSCNDSQIR